ncbi:MAG TPA: TonB-dependent receptor [Gemmatimonadaceae bacterium]|nr:TonB-dependent receptor [Gemmatimonadaceae bacterium]
MRFWHQLKKGISAGGFHVSGLLASVALLSSSALAQTGSITGRVTDSASAQGIVGARIQAISSANAVSAALSGTDGAYRIANLQPGTYTVQVSRIGFAMRRVPNVNVTAGGSATVDVSLTVVVTELNPVVTTASRREEKILEAPASISVVDVRQIQERPSVTVADHVKGVPGVDVNQGGVMQANIVARGFNNAFSGSILTLQDYRFASVPSLRVNVPYLFTGTNEDVERVEVLLGPASALYGPNSANGVLHVITKSPFTQQGTTLTIDGGTRSLLRTAVRTAHLLGDKAGFKLSGEYFMAKEWEYDDPGEPDVFPTAAPAGRRGTPNVRDFDLQRTSGEARLDLRPTATTEFVSTLGYTNLGSGMEYTGANGTAQVKNWTYMSLQQRARVGRWFGQIFANFSDAGNEDSLDLNGTFLLRSGQPIVDQSRVVAAQLQHSWDFGSRQGFVYGLDWINTEPRTGNTINGRNEDDDEVTEVGGYIQSTTRLHSMWDFIAALRLDNHSRIEGNQFSPRAALIFKPTATQNWRLTYNRAFQTPANFTMFLDLIQARNIQNSGYDIRAVGNPPERGWQFNRTCQNTVSGGLCMMSRFTGGNTFVNATANTAYPGLLTALAPQITQLLTPQLGAQRAQAVAQMLAGLRPTDAQVGTRITYLNNAANPALDLTPGQVEDITPLEASYNYTYELGYKGILGDNVRLAVDAWYQKRGDVGNPAGLATPSIFFNGQSLGAYIGPNIAAELVRQGFTPAQAQAAAAAITPVLVAGQPGVPGLAAVPLGIVQFNDTRFATATDIFATYTSSRYKEFDVKGIDVAADWAVNDVWTVATTYSWVSDLLFPDILSSNNRALALNAPDNKATLAFKYNSEPRGIGYEIRGRYANGYPVNSGVYATDTPFLRPGVAQTYVYEPVTPQAFLDLSFSWRVPVGGREALWSIMGTNVTNNKRRSFPGYPEIGAMVMTRLQYTF